jgi:opacity protein-like surface antigen
MKANFSAAAAIALALSGAAHAADVHDHSPKHGGVLVEVKNMDYELVAKANVVQLYLRERGNKVDVSKSSAKITLLTGSEKQEVELQPAGDKLEANGSFKVGPGTKAVAVVTMNGKPATALFTLK